MAKLDWDREAREARARRQGREPASVALASGISQLAGRWRSVGAREIWVQPVLAKRGGIVVLLPRSDLESWENWLVVATSAAGKQIADPSGQGEHVVQLRVVSPWKIEVFHVGDGSRRAKGVFTDYHPQLFE
jgi:hypothetical protein